ncbi:Lysophospholipase, alpha-beta hydrolase superfamily [Geodermatophilus saharensis]|uniref:Lysophospholipase, alpha-beta hydrolase superfamily n=1 Tax=Geodermatophilus saharensis TaxID=1137994 RepID=A0A239EP09_9ACTN|nr:alpha/beta fold hydrolase [Geodermatophilus saharensis]SNS45773.1 Lysophospholipase, alpha-beta hydrolase superfamily [Geodermatophilus saharensis]
MPFFDGSRGRIHHTAWLPPGEVRAVVVLCHGGLGEHVGLYGALGERLAADGIAVHALDALGHGRSDGERDLMPTWDVFVDDASTLAGIARAQHPGRPLVLAGHSGGSLAALLLAQRSPGTADALLLSAPPAAPLPWMEDLAAAGDGYAEPPDPAEVFSTHPEYLHALRTDPLVYRGPLPPQTVRALVRTWPEIEAGVAAGRPGAPTLLLHGELDPMVPVEHSRTLAARLPRATLRVFPGDLHDVLNEHDRDAVHDVVAEFVLAQVRPAVRA